MQRTRGLLTTAMAFALVTSLAGCGRDAGSGSSGVSSTTPSRIQEIGECQPISQGLLPDSPDEWVAVVDPLLVDLEQVQLALGISVIGAEDYGDVAIVLFDDPSGVLGAGDFGLPGVIVGVPNDVVDLAEGGSLVIGFIGGDWGLSQATSQVGFEALALDDVHAIATGVGTKIGIVDTGTRLDHLAFAGNLEVLQNHRLTSGELEGNGIDDDDDGLTDEGLGHGTLVAGIAAMVAPDADIFPVKVLNDDGVGSMLGIIAGILVCRDHGCDVINLSIVLSDYDDEFEALLGKLASEGVVTTCAAGNNTYNNPRYPATSPYTVGVAAVDRYDVMPAFSGGGPLIRIAAPGHRVTGAGVQAPRGLAGGSGTSLASPVVAGSIAVVREALGCSAVFAMQQLSSHTDPIHPAGGVATGRVDPLQSMSTSGL